MNSYVQLTLNEYDELKKIQVEATTLVEQTNKNLSRKLTEANEKITELESELRVYCIGGARRRPEQEMPPISEVKQIIQLIANDEPKQVRGSAKLGRSPWSVDDDHTIINSEGKLVSKLASELSRTEAAIRSRASHLGCKVKHKKIVKKT